MISKKTIDDILFATKIEEVVGDFVALKRAGQNFVGICPFHDDRNPSMHVSPKLGIYKCFVCDAKGNAIHFLMEHEKITYPDALRYLAKKYSISIEEDEPETAEQIAARDEKESLYIVNTFAEKYFMEQLLHSEEGKMLGLTYFKERGFKDSTIEHFHLGYNPGGWDSFTQAALKNGFKKEHLLKLGLTKESESGKLFDFYRGRVIFPIHSTLGKVIGFGGRVLKKDDKVAKYFNSPESEIYHKSDTLYDLYLAKKAIRSQDNVYLVEGYTDVISMMESGIENVVASSGTSLTEGQIKILASQTKNITVLYDGDAAGIKASLRGIDLLLAKGLNVRVVLLPDGEDPDSFAKKHRDSELQEYLKNNATDFLLFKAQILSKDAGNDPMKKATMINEMIKSIADVPDTIARALYVKECAERFGISETTLNDGLRKLVWKKLKGDGNQAITTTEYSTIQPEKPAEKETDLIYEAEKNLILLLLSYGLYEIIVETDNHAKTVEYSRVDQYLYNEFIEDDLIFQNVLFNEIFTEYPTVAQIAQEQDEVKRYFANSPNKEISDFAIQYLLSENPNFSPQWEKRYDMYTKTIDNSTNTLQHEVQNCLLMLKLRIVEQYLEMLKKELEIEEYGEEDKLLITQKYSLLLKCKKEIACQLNMVVSK